MALNRDAVTHDQIISPAGQKQVERKRPLPPLNNKGNTQIPPNRAKSWPGNKNSRESSRKDKPPPRGLDRTMTSRLANQILYHSEGSGPWGAASKMRRRQAGARELVLSRSPPNPSRASNIAKLTVLAYVDTNDGKRSARSHFRPTAKAPVPPRPPKVKADSDASLIQSVPEPWSERHQAALWGVGQLWLAIVIISRKPFVPYVQSKRRLDIRNSFVMASLSSIATRDGHPSF
ncbi:hypothetical protein P885DRAFT_56813 [Corynascus similis CBS 632.67]